MTNTGKTLAIVIPLLFLGYLFYSNFLVSHDSNYFYNVGSEKDGYLSPKFRISGKFIQEDVNYRNLTSQLVYFSVPIKPGSDSVTITARFKDNFPKNAKMSIGASDNSTTWHYKYNLIFDEKEYPNPDEEWFVRETSFDIKEDNLSIKNGKLSVLFRVPHLSTNANETNTYYIPIDWINVTVHKEGWLW